MMINETERPHQIAVNFGPISGHIERQEIYCQTAPTQAETTTEQTARPGRFRIRKGQKSNFAKVVYTMYKLNMFEDEQGQYATNKQHLFDELGCLFDTDFKNVDQLLNEAKKAQNCFEVFDRMRTQMQKYEEK